MHKAWIHTFTNLFGMHMASLTKKELNFCKILLNYVVEATLVLGKPWKKCKYLYFPCCTNNHWIAFQINLEEWTIYMFNNLKNHVLGAALETYILPLQKVIPLLIKLHVTRDEKYSMKKFKFVKLKDVLQLRNG